MEWNLSILWAPEPGNESSTIIRISWDSNHAAESDFESFKLYEKNTMVANLLSNHSFSFPSNGTLHQFQIIGQGTPINGTVEKRDLLILPILLGISVLIIAIVFFIFYKRKK